MTRINLKNSLVLATAALVVVSGAGCKKEQPPPPPAPVVIQKPKVVAQKPVSSVNAPLNLFDFSKKKDPFKPYVVAKPDVSTKTARKPDTPALPIHSFALEQFRLIGVVADPNGSRAMVVDPAGKGYVLKVGMSIGSDEARVTRIDGAGVDVLRQFRDESGKTRKETVKIPLLRKP